LAPLVVTTTTKFPLLIGVVTDDKTEPAPQAALLLLLAMTFVQGLAGLNVGLTPLLGAPPA
jgi:hypothetical protein